MKVNQGFRKSRITTDGVLVFKEINESRIEFNKETHLVFVDFPKAFNSVLRDTLWSLEATQVI